MPKEDRSDWVAVEPEFAAASSSTPEIRKASSAYQFFQKDVSNEIKAQLTAQTGKFDIADFGRAVRDRWNELSDSKREHYENLARQDQARFQRESHAADVAALERREQLQQERETLLLDDEGGNKRTTRKGFEKKQRKKSRKEAKERQMSKKSSDDDEEFQEESEVSDDFDSDELSDDSSEEARRRKKPPPRQLTQKQTEHREKLRKEKQEKEQYIQVRQQDLRKEKSAQAKRRLEFLLKQSNIFAHFGNVKEDSAKYGIRQAARKEGDNVRTRRDADAENGQDEEAALEEADEHEATYLTVQPSTLGHGKMRDYQLEGLNWMIRLQENGVNGILADEVRFVR